MHNFLANPYAYGALIRHEFDTDHLNIWIIFAYSMNQNVKPGLEKWTCYVDAVEKPVTASIWQDAHTLLLTVPNVGVLPDRVLLKYDGPGPIVWEADDPARETLEIAYHKQWEPWGPALSFDITT